MSTIAPELAPPTVETVKPPPLTHYIRAMWWERLFLPRCLWRVRDGDRTLCGLVYRGHRKSCKIGVLSEPRACIVCQDLLRSL